MLGINNNIGKIDYSLKYFKDIYDQDLNYTTKYKFKKAWTNLKRSYNICIPKKY
jgi:hypothetical protein